MDNPLSVSQYCPRLEKTAGRSVTYPWGRRMKFDEFRQLLRTADASLLTVEDRLALIDLLCRCFDHQSLQSPAAEGTTA